MSNICPLCTSENFQHHRFGLMRCKNCELVLAPSIWQPHTNEMMEVEWFGETYQPETSIWVRWFESWNNRRTIRRLGKVTPMSNRLLEIGVGSGSFLKFAREQGFDVMGCDLSQTICKRVSSIHGITMYCGPLAEIEGEACFDIIVMNHVLEHINNPVEFLNDVYRILTPGGMVHVAVPNVACWEARFLPGWNSYEPYHLAYYTTDTLRKAVSASRLEVKSLETHESFSGWFLAILRTLLKVDNTYQTNQSNSKLTRATTDKSRFRLVEHAYRMAMVCIGGGLWPLRILQAKLGHGDEVICIARKSLVD